MSALDLGLTSHCCRSSQRDRRNGAGIVHWLRGCSFQGDSAGSFLQASLKLPLSVASYLALRKLRPEDFEKKYLRLKIGKRERICWIYNSWEGCPRSAVSFLALPRNLDCFASAFLPEISPKTKLLEVLRLIEAGHVGHFPPLLISIYGGRFSAAQPGRILLDAQEIIALADETKFKRNFSRVPVAVAVRQLAQARRIGDPSARAVALDEIRAEMRRTQQTVDERQAAAFMAVDDVYKKLLPLQSAERESRAIVSAVRIWDEAKPNVMVGSPEDLAMSMIEDIGFLKLEESEGEVTISDRAPRNRRRNVERPRDLYHPQVVLQHYGLGNPPPLHVTDIKKSCCRIGWCILAHGGRRASCLSQIIFGDFIHAINPITGERVVDLIVRGTKSQKESMMRLPLSLLWPQKEVTHLLDLLRTVQEAHPTDWATMSLMEVIAGEPVTRNDIDERSIYLRRELPKERSWLHLPRANFASWLPIRILCARDRGLLERSWFPRLRECEWFSEAMLVNLSTLVGNEATDALEVARRITGHASTFELISSYCSSWAIQGEMLQAF